MENKELKEIVENSDFQMELKGINGFISGAEGTELFENFSMNFLNIDKNEYLKSISISLNAYKYTDKKREEFDWFSASTTINIPEVETLIKYLEITVNKLKESILTDCLTEDCEDE